MGEAGSVDKAMSGLMTEVLATLRSRGVECIIISLDGTQTHWTGCQTHALLSTRERDRMILETAAHVSPVFQKHLQEALGQLEGGHRG